MVVSVVVGHLVPAAVGLLENCCTIGDLFRGHVSGVVLDGQPSWGGLLKNGNIVFHGG